MESQRNNELLGEYNSFLTQQEEDERERRLLEKEEAVARRVNAQQVANMVVPGHGAHTEEVERERRLQDRDESIARRVVAHEVSNLFKDGEAEEAPRLLTFPMLNQLEEHERQRRLDDRDEAVARKSHAQDASDAVRRESATIKARFVKRPSLWKRISSNPSAVGRVVYNNLTHAPAATLGNTYDAAKSLAGGLASTAASYIPSFASLVNKATSIKDTVMHNIPFVEHPWTLADVKAAEELERLRRIAEDKNSFAVGNARKVSHLVRFARERPLHKAFLSGFHRYTNGWEERERTRRLANKDEMQARRTLACRVANCINQLGWPFIRSAKGKCPITPSAALAEEERMRLLSDPAGMLTSRFNAKKVANCISDAFTPFDHGTMARYTRNLEEKERRRRMRHPDESIHQAHRLADVIRGLGAPFYVPTSTIAEEFGKLDYDKARRPSFDTLDMSHHRLQARKAAKRANKALSPRKTKKDIQLSQEITQEKPKDIDTRWMEEYERKARIGDKALQQLAMENAHKVSGMINKKKGPYKERQVSFKPDVEIIYAQPSTISPPSQPLMPMERIIAAVHPVEVIFPQAYPTISPHSQPLMPLEHIIAAVHPVEVIFPQAYPTISPPSQQLAPMARTVCPVQPAQISHPVELPSPVQHAKAHFATALPGSPYPERVHATPMYEAPFANDSPYTQFRQTPVTEQQYISSPVPPGPVSTFVFPEQQQQQRYATPFATPFAAPAVTPVLTPVAAPVMTPVLTPVMTPVPTPVLTPVAAPVAVPVAKPAVQHHHTATPSPSYSFPPKKVEQPAEFVQAKPAVFAPPVASTVSNSSRVPPVTKPMTNITPVTKPISNPTPVTRPVSNTFAPVPVSKPPTVGFLSAPSPVSQPMSVGPAPASMLKPASVIPSATSQQPLPQQYNAAPAHQRGVRQAHYDPIAQQKLVESVHKLYDAENTLAEKERQKMLSYQQKNSGWARFRAQRHAAAAARHSDNAKRHQDWLNIANPGQSAL